MQASHIRRTPEGPTGLGAGPKPHQRRGVARHSGTTPVPRLPAERSSLVGRPVGRYLAWTGQVAERFAVSPDLLEYSLFQS